MNRCLVLCCILILSAGLAAAQPVVNTGGVLNVASYAYTGLPNSEIAQGSVFAIFGTGLGPTAFAQVSAFPLQTTFQGVSISVSQGSGIAVAAIPVFVFATQVNAIMPSTAPVGACTLTVTYNGKTSAPVPVQVSAASFGIFAVNQAGRGEGVFTNGANQPNSVAFAANPGEILNIWGTGLGAISGSDGTLPPTGNINANSPVVYVGGVQLTPAYHGRSGCCSGIDQVQFTVPPNITGCNVPVAVLIGSVVSNYTTIAIAASGRTCSDPTGVPASVFGELGGTGTASVGNVSFAHTTVTVPIPLLGGTQTVTSDSETATFDKYTFTHLGVSALISVLNFGACSVFTFQGSSPPLLTGQVQITGLDAGSAITATRGNGFGDLKPAGSGTGLYSADFALTAGAYVITGPGGKDVGPINFNLQFPQALTWTNESAVTANPITRSAGVEVTWSGADPNSVVNIEGFSFSGSSTSDLVGAGFLCTAPASANKFTVPPVVLLALPPSNNQVGLSPIGGTLTVGNATHPVPFTATGLNFGLAVSSASITQLVTYQ